ncbi:MAG: 50S ribosomal protein L1 [Candidatus Doudnabacteria bacterium]|nr:50S ribosomal protein L1 [Candidatus Doudnabacteria bacterium]
MKKSIQLPQNYNDQTKYSIEEAVVLLPQLSTSKFVGSVDLDIVLNLTEKQKKETIRGSIVFPNRFGDELRVVVIADEKDAKDALKAGATDAGGEDMIKKIEDGKVEFDIVIATPVMMPKVAKLGKVLGPKGLMPNPANETVTPDVAKVVGIYKSGKQNFKMTEQGAVRMRVAKLDMTAEQLTANIVEALKSVLAAARKLNAQPFRKITLSPTMGKPVKLDVNGVMEVLK